VVKCDYYLYGTVGDNYVSLSHDSAQQAGHAAMGEPDRRAGAGVRALIAGASGAVFRPPNQIGHHALASNAS